MLSIHVLNKPAKSCYTADMPSNGGLVPCVMRQQPGNMQFQHVSIVCKALDRFATQNQSRIRTRAYLEIWSDSSCSIGRVGMGVPVLYMLVPNGHDCKVHWLAGFTPVLLVGASAPFLISIILNGSVLIKSCLYSPLKRV